MPHARRDATIEIMRVVACFLVICIHINCCVYAIPQYAQVESSVLLSCLRADAVAMFWFITGAFFFRTTSYTRLLRRTWTRIALPALIVFVALFYLSGWLYDGVSLSQSVTRQPSDYLNFFRALLLDYDIPVAHNNAAWYVFVYILLCLLFPACKAINDSIDTDRKCAIFLAVSLGFLTWNDLSGNVFASFGSHAFQGVLPSLIEIITGRIVYERREQILHRVHAAWFALAFLVINGVRSLLQTWAYRTFPGDNQIFSYSYMGQSRTFMMNPAPESILYWYSACGMLCSAAMFLTLYGLFRHLNSDGVTAGVARHLGSVTFDIYLVHMPVIDLLVGRGILSRVYERVAVTGSLLINQVFYYAVMGLTVFVLCYGVALVVKGVRAAWRGISRAFPRRDAGSGVAHHSAV